METSPVLDRLTSAGGLHRLLLIGATVLAAGTALAADVSRPAAAQDPSGWYDEMLLSARGHEVTGVFASARGIDPNGGRGPMFSRYFMLQGRVVGDRADIVSGTPGDTTVIRGSLVLSPPEVRLRLHQDQDGCGMATGDMTHEDRVLTRVSPGPDWIGVGMVGTKPAVLRAKPAENTGRPPHLGFTPYLVQHDAVATLQRQAGWARVHFLGSERHRTGWLRETELTPFTSWPTRENEP